MNRNNPIVIIEDDKDDQEIFTQAFKNLAYPNEIIFFSDGEAALKYLHKSTSVPFLILSDINMPKLDGFALKKILKEDAVLSQKSIPYLFFSTSLNQKAVKEAYNLCVQGFFVKEDRLDEIEKTLRAIMEYWKRCASPNNY
ncbi:MAG: response regulator [Ferruginibacter sp.]